MLLNFGKNQNQLLFQNEFIIIFLKISSILFIHQLQMFPDPSLINEDSYSCHSHEITPKKLSGLMKIGFKKEYGSTIPKTNCFDSQNKSISYFRSQEKKKVKKLWSKQEDDLLRELVETKGAKQWAYISTFFKNRCGKQCRQRWHNHLRNGIKKGDWTLFQEWILYLGVNAYGKRWSIISKILKGRTQNTLKNHWNCKMKPKKVKFLHSMRKILAKSSNELDMNLNSIEIKLIKQIQKNNDGGIKNNLHVYLRKIEQMSKAMMQFKDLRKKVRNNIEVIRRQRNYLFNTNDDDYQQFQSPQLIDKIVPLPYNFQTFGKKLQSFESKNDEAKQEVELPHIFKIKQEIFISDSNDQDSDLFQYLDFSKQCVSNEKEKTDKSQEEKSSNNHHMNINDYYFQSPSKNILFGKISLEKSDQKN